MPKKTPHISTLLPPTRLDALRSGFGARKAQLAAILQNTLPNLYGPSKIYIDAILESFDKNAPKDTVTTRNALSDADRERCTIALLAAQGGGLTLAVHIYIALMLELTPQEVAHILLLTGVYSGVGNFTNGLMILSTMLSLLQKKKTVNSPKQVYELLKKTFPA